MTDRIVFFGCSVTYGHGLPDCIIDGIDPGSSHSNMGYPKIVGERLGKTVINRSLPGSANMRVLNRIVEFEFKPTDTVFVQWTIFNRSGIFSTEPGSCENILEIRPWTEGSFAKQFYSIHTEYDLYHQTMFFIHHANQYLKDKVSKVVNVSLVTGLNDTIETNISIPAWFNIDLNYWVVSDITIDLADDNSHPGLKSQEYLADLVIDLIQE